MKIFLSISFTFLFLLAGYGVSVAQTEDVFEEIIFDENTSEEEVVELFESLGIPGFGDDVNNQFADVFVDTGVSCFDYYRFGSVEANITTQVAEAVNGVPITFNTVITNTNPYPILHGTLYVKVFKLRESLEKNQNGPYVVDQFVVRDGISLDAQETKEVVFDWKIPSWTENGDYRIATFFISNESYNFLGLSFTDDIVGNSVNFRVNSDVRSGVSFDKDSVRINDDSYGFAMFPPRFTEKEPITITAPIRNTTNQEVAVPVTFTLYAWDAMRTGNELLSRTQWITVPANTQQNFSFTVTDVDHPVYLAEISLQHQDTKSILNPRFVRAGIDKIRLNYPGVTTFPLRAGQEVTLFSCLHNMNDAVTSGRLMLTLYDENRTLIHQYEYAGNVSGDMMGVAESFVPKRDYGTIFLEAKLFDADGTLIEEAMLMYNCDALATCTPVDMFGESDWLVMYWKWIAGGISFVFLLIILSLLVKARKRVTPENI